MVGRPIAAGVPGAWPGWGDVVDSSGDSPAIVLALNAGSRSLKAAVRDPELDMRIELLGLDATAARLTVSATGSFVEHGFVHGGWAAAVPAVAEAVTRRGVHPDVVVHRIVHGSPALVAPRRADDALLTRLAAEAHLSPLHLPRQLAVVEEARERWPWAAVVVCPDGSFYRDLPDEAVTLPLPPAARAAGLRRWGFDGLAVQSVVGQLPGTGGAVVVHLGAGCSVAAVEHGRAVHTTTSVGPAGGIPSSTRSGDLDPEVVLRVLDLYDGSVPAVRTLLSESSGVAGLSGGRADPKELLEAGDSAADLALRVFTRQVALAVGGAVTTLETWDTLVFTGGVGVQAPEIRERICARLLALLPGAAERAGAPSERLTAAGVRVRAIPADEEAVLDRMARAVLLTPAAAGDAKDRSRAPGPDLGPAARQRPA